ncbi:MAG: hypothetical protein ACE5KX_08110 [Acidimicrobiia bacterium]
MPALALWTPEDGLLGAVAPLGLAAAAGTALVVDLDPEGPGYPGPASLAELVRDGPRRSDLQPQRRGMAVLRNGGIPPHQATQVVDALMAGWESVVLRLPPRPAPAQRPVPVVRVHPLFPGGLFPPPDGPAAYQATGWRVPSPGPGPVLPRPRPETLARLLAGVVPARDRWLRAWGEVWRYPWER